MRTTLKNSICCLFLLSLLTACSQNTQNLANVDTADLYQLQNVKNVPLPPGSTQTSATLSNLRIRALQDSAMSLGAQGGLAWSSERLDKRMEQDGKYLDTIFNFNAMLLTHGVIPPVLEMGDNTLNLADPDTIRVSDRTYKIIQQARFATTAPNWREYLWLSFPKPELPDKSLLPRTCYEQKIWRAAVAAGWEKGVVQSYSIFQQNLARLKRDYRGMMIYRNLLQQKMISPPFVARTELGVTGDGSNMHINDQVLRIVEHPALQTNSRNWKAIVVQHNEHG
jgi:defect-in-organelle-trafficking protein DotC